MQTAEELSRRHAPAHTTVTLDRAPGVFGDVLEQKLRADGFALTSSGFGGLGVSYRLDVLDSEGIPMQGYAQVSCTDGQMFSFTREVFKGTEAPRADLPEEHPLDSRPLPEHAASAPAPPAPVAMDAAPSVRSAPVRSTAKAAVIARRSGLPVGSFCRWNDVQPDTVLAKGRTVYLSQPPLPASESLAPVTPVVAQAPESPAPMPEPVSLPSRAQTSPKLTLEKPTPGAPVPYTPIAASMPAAQIPPAVTPIAETPVASPAPAASTREARLPVAAPAIEAVPVWEIHKGVMLRNLMNGWAAIAGYSVIWNAQNDYEMRSSATFSGVFIDAVRDFFAALQANGLALRVTIYQGNKVMEVSEH